ncbi:MAG: hypothetical protein LUG24_09190 [Clostridiales bacterium]|nr:hypothetical protein [Clostridiales bacterium]
MVDRSETEMGRTAMKMLFKRLSNPLAAVEKEVVPVKLILRGSEKLRNRENNQ